MLRLMLPLASKPVSCGSTAPIYSMLPLVLAGIAKVATGAKAAKKGCMSMCSAESRKRKAESEKRKDEATTRDPQPSSHQTGITAMTAQLLAPIP